MEESEQQPELTHGEVKPEITVTIKPSSAEAKYTITIPLSMTTHELKVKLSGSQYAGVAPERQRLIYSGRVLKDPETVDSYKIKDGNTIHMVKSAAATATGGSSSTASSATPASGTNVPTTFAAGPGNDPLAGLTGARYAGHVQLPGAGMFGPDGGMGPPPDANEMMELMNSPGTSEAINQMMSNPQVIDQMLRHPMFQNNPQMRQALQNPEMRRQLFSPEAIRQAVMLQQSAQQMGLGNFGMGTGGGQGNQAFPAPGATDQTPQNSEGSQTSAGAGQGANPFAAMLGSGGLVNPFANMNPSAAGTAGTTTAGPNPFAAFFGQNPAGTAGSPMQNSPFGIPSTGTGPQQGMPFGMPADMNAMMRQMMQVQQAQAADTRPPEVRYEEQLQQLNAMGLHDFERNVAALRRSGGNVQAAIEFLFSS